MRRLRTFDDPDENAPTLVSAATIHTIDPTRPRATHLLIDHGRVVAVGDREECQNVADERGLARVEELDLGSAVVVPGFIDPHAHPLMYGQMMTWVDCGPTVAGSIAEIIERLREQAAKTPGNQPIRGYGYEHRNLAERRHPTRLELDEVAADREVYLMNASGHGGVVNTFTLDRAGVTAQTPNPPGGTFFRDADGLTGELSDAACNILTGVDGVKVGRHGPNFHLADEPDEHLRQLGVAQEKFLAAGVTTVGDAQVSRREFDMYLRLAEQDDLRMRVSMYFLSHLLEEGIEIGMQGAFGNAHLAFAGFKFYADGTLGGWTAYFPDGYVGDPCRTGQLYHDPADYAAMIARAHSFGLQTATHAQSPTAIEMVVSAIEAALAEHPDPDARHRIEHCGLPTPEQIGRMASAGIYPVNQTQHYYNWGEGVTQAIGTPGERFNPLGEFAQAGVPVTLSSDAPVAEPNPLQAIQVAVERKTRLGHQLGSEDLKITAEQALRGHTLSGAFALGREDDLGSLAVGKRADFAVLAGDPLAVPAHEIGDIPVLQTWVGGRQASVAEPADVAGTSTGAQV